MRSCRLLLTLALVVGVGSACSDDAEDPDAATGSRDAFCTELRVAVEGDLTVFDPLAPVSPEDTEAATTRLADAAPAAVVDEMRLLAGTFAEVTAVLAEVDLSDAAAAERIQALDIDEGEIAAAQAAVTGYALDECRIDLAAINAASVTTLPPTSTTIVPETVPPTTLPPVTG